MRGRAGKKRVKRKGEPNRDRGAAAADYFMIASRLKVSAWRVLVG